MIEETDYEVTFTFKDRQQLTITMTESSVDTMFDKLWEREPIKWMNIWEHIINLDDVRYIYYKEMEK